MKRALILLSSLVLLAASAAAWTEEQKGAIDVDFREAELSDALAGFAALTESRLELDPDLTGPVTLRLDRVKWSTALDALCDSVGCTWRLSDGERRVLKVDRRLAGVEEPISVTLREADSLEVMRAIARILRGELQLDENLRGPVSITLERVAASTALDAICQGIGCEWQFLEADPRVLVVKAPDEPAASRWFGVENTKPRSIREALEGPVTLQLDRVPAEDVFRAIASVTRVEAHVFGVDGTVTRNLQDVTLREALDELCHQLQCHWRLEGDTEPRRLIVER